MTGAPPPLRGSWSRLFSMRLVMIALIMILPVALPNLSIVQHLDNQLTALRAAAAPRAVSGTLVFAAIDKKSLDTVGIWPWPRSVHADLIDRLVAAGAQDIFVDIDFSTPSNPEGDARLAKALEDAGGGVILPLFRQPSGVGAGEDLGLTRPLPMFADNAWTALVDVALDGDGLMRSFPVTALIDGVPTQSAPAVLAGFSDALRDRLDIDFSIRPETVPTYSIADILSGTVSAEDLRGRSVVVGAYATELKDLFAVPVHGILSGPMLHILAAETMKQDRLLRPIGGAPVGYVLAVLIVGYALTLHRLSLAVPLAASAALVILGETAAFLLYRDHALIFDTAALWIMLAFGLVLLMWEKIGLNGWLADIAFAENRDIRRVLKRVISDSVDSVIILDQRLGLLDTSQTTIDMLDLSAPIPRGTPLSDFAPRDLVEAVGALAAEHQTAPNRVHSAQVAFSLPARAGHRHLEAVLTISPFETRSGRGLSSVGSHVVCLTVRDVTARRHYETRLEEMSRIDDLTGLLTRRGLCQAMETAGSGFCVFVIDLHRFGHLNATLGREKGDNVLKAVAARLRRFAGIDGLAARIGGDLLCLATPGTADGRGLKDQALEILALFNTSFGVDGLKVELNARIGACSGTTEIGNPGRWIEAAELALDEAKRVGGGGWRAYDPASAQRHARSRLLEAELKTGLEQGQFFLLYQPQVDFASGRLTGAEALIRWQHPELGTISPAEFISISEANGFICDLGRFMFIEACKTATTWPTHISVAVNASPVQFLRGDMLDDIRQALAISGLAPHRLHVEITESMFLERSEDLFTALDALRALGVTIALDDFGTGYSSLSYISSLPLDKLKIDQSFIRELVSDPAARSIVQTIKSLAQGLGLTVVCEGVENAVQCQLLKLMGCEEGQGYYFGRPQPAQDILSLSAVYSVLSDPQASNTNDLAVAG